MDTYLDTILEIVDEYRDNSPRSKFTLLELKMVLAKFAMECFCNPELAKEAADLHLEGERIWKEKGLEV